MTWFERFYGVGSGVSYGGVVWICRFWVCGELCCLAAYAFGLALVSLDWLFGLVSGLILNFLFRFLWFGYRFDVYVWWLVVGCFCGQTVQDFGFGMVWVWIGWSCLFGVFCVYAICALSGCGFGWAGDLDFRGFWIVACLVGFVLL